MNTLKSIYCRHIIAQPNYYRDRAIQMGETWGAWAAELRMAPLKSSKEKQCQRMINRYHGKMWWYARRVTPFSETLDYET
jgi:hypothetical protein